MHEEIRKWREKAGLSQRMLAEKLFLTPQAISLIEQGKRGISFAQFQRIAQLLGKEIKIIQVEENVLMRKITRENIELEMKPFILNQSLIRLDDNDLQTMLSHDGETYFCKTSSKTIFDATVDIIAEFSRKEEFKNCKGAMLTINAPACFAFDDLEFYSSHFSKRISEETFVMIGCHIDEKLEEYTLALSLFGV